MRPSKTTNRRPENLAEAAGDFLNAALGPIEEQFKGRLEELGEVSVIFTWNDRNYRVTLSPYSEVITTPRKARKKDSVRD
jgi:hypothetical protein